LHQIKENAKDAKGAKDARVVISGPGRAVISQTKD